MINKNKIIKQMLAICCVFAMLFLITITAAAEPDDDVSIIPPASSTITGVSSAGTSSISSSHNSSAASDSTASASSTGSPSSTASRASSKSDGTSSEKAASSKSSNNTSSKKSASSQYAGTIGGDADDDQEEVEWGAEFESEAPVSIDPNQSTEKAPNKNISDPYAAALNWIWLPILLICASVFALIAVNYKAHKEKKARLIRSGANRPAPEVYADITSDSKKPGDVTSKDRFDVNIDDDYEDISSGSNTQSKKKDDNNIRKPRD